jgi:predicted lipoprotein with Yx(FWY)xxD motif
VRRIIGVGTAAVLLLAACGGKSNTNGPSSGGSPQQQDSGIAGRTVRPESVQGFGAVLVDPRGFTLYHLKTETTSNIQCTGDCASTWPPLLLSGGGSPTGGVRVAGELGTVTRPDGGVQVTFMGLTLYTYSGDTGSRQVHGQGVGGVWFVVTPSGLSGPAVGGSGGGYNRYGSSPSPSDSSPYGY